MGAPSSYYDPESRALVVPGATPRMLDALRAMPRRYAELFDVLPEGAPAPRAGDRSFTCRCGRWWRSRAMETAGGCCACAPEKSWAWDEQRGVRVNYPVVEGVKDLLDRR